MPTPATNHAADHTADQSEAGRRPLARSMLIGLVLFGIGVAFIAVNILPFFFGTTDRPLWLNLGCLAAPAGFITAVVSTWRAGRDTQRRAARELA